MDKDNEFKKVAGKISCDGKFKHKVGVAKGLYKIQYPQHCMTMDGKGSDNGDLLGLTRSHSAGDCQTAGDNRLKKDNGGHKYPRP